DLLHHAVRHKLRQKIGTLKVDVDQSIEGCFIGVGDAEDVGALGGGDAGVVDQQIDPAEGTDGFLNQPHTIQGQRDVRLNGARFHADHFELGADLLGRLHVAGAVDDDGEF